MKNDINIKETNNNRRCDFWKFNILRASYAEHFGSLKRLENEKPNIMIIPEWLFVDLIENEKNYGPLNLYEK